MDKRLQSALDWSDSWLKPLRQRGIEVFLAGGAFRSYFLGQELNDLDLWFPNAYHQTMAASYFHSRAQSLDVPPDGQRYAVDFEMDGVKIQLVNFEYFTNVEAVLEQFDFTVCMCGAGEDYIAVHEDYFTHLDQKRLVLNSLENPAQFFYRLQKYNQKGFSMLDEDVQKVIDGIQIWDGEECLVRMK